MDMALKKLVQIYYKKKKQVADEKHVAFFNVAVLATPLKLLTRMISELKWVATTSTNNNKNQTLQKSQFRLLTQRLAREHTLPTSEEQKTKEKRGFLSCLQEEIVQ